MPARSKIMQLPPHIKAEFDRRLIERNFSGYEEMTAWLNERLQEDGLGEIVISVSGAHRYGQGFEEKIAAIKIATEQAKAITDALGDDADKLGQSLTALCQERAFNVLVKMNELDPENVNFNKLIVGVAKLNSSSVAVKKLQMEIKEKARETAEDVVKVARTGGMSEKTAEEIKKKILGIV